MTVRGPGLREQKKRATTEALRQAALRLALERGLDNVRVDDIAAAAGVSPRTYNNYFSSREQAVVAAITADRESRIAAAVLARPARVRLSTAVIDAVVEQCTDPGDDAVEVMLLVTTNPSLRTAYVDAASEIELPLADALTTRSGLDPATAQVLAAAVGAASKVGLRRWLERSSASSTGFVVVTGSLPALMRAALAPLAPALDAAAERSAR